MKKTINVNTNKAENIYSSRISNNMSHKELDTMFNKIKTYFNNDFLSSKKFKGKKSDKLTTLRSMKKIFNSTYREKKHAKVKKAYAPQVVVPPPQAPNRPVNILTDGHDVLIGITLRECKVNIYNGHFTSFRMGTVIPKDENKKKAIEPFAEDKNRLYMYCSLVANNIYVVFDSLDRNNSVNVQFDINTAYMRAIPGYVTDGLYNVYIGFNYSATNAETHPILINIDGDKLISDYPAVVVKLDAYREVRFGIRLEKVANANANIIINDEDSDIEQEDEELRDIKYIKIIYDIEANNNVINNNCVNEFFYKFFNERYVASMKGVTYDDFVAGNFAPNTDKIIDFINMYRENGKWTQETLSTYLKDRYCYHIYDRDLNVIDEQVSRNHAKTRTLYFIVANNHLYPITSEEITQIRDLKSKNMIKRLVKDVKYMPKDELNKTLIAKVYESAIQDIEAFITSDKIQVKKIKFNNILYTNDEQSVQLYDLLMKYDKLDKYLATFNFTDTKLISDLLKIGGYTPSFTHFMGAPMRLHFTSGEEGKYKIDKNKAYTNYFLKTEYLPIIDTSCEVINYNNEEIVATNMYYITDYNKYLDKIICNGWTSGYRLMKIQNINELCVITKYIVPKLVKNNVRDIFNDILNKDKDTISIIRNSINKFIGTCRILPSAGGSLKTVRSEIFTNETEIKKFCTHHTGFNLSLGSLLVNNDNPQLYIGYKNKTIESSYLCNNLISYYIEDQCVADLYAMQMELVDMFDDLVFTEIKIDSISFNTSSLNPYILRHIHPFDIDMWKLVKYTYDKEDNRIESFDYDTYNALLSMKPNDNNESNARITKKDTELYHGKLYIDKPTTKSNVHIYYGYAGCGKSELIMKQILPLINDTEYIILAFQNINLKAYRAKGYKCMSCDMFLSDLNKIAVCKQSYQHIIIDEAGLISSKHYNELLKLIRFSTHIHLLGDHKQLNPIGDTVNSFSDNGLLRLLSRNIVFIPNNYRNHYTNDEYELMLKGEYQITEYEKSRMINVNYVRCDECFKISKKDDKLCCNTCKYLLNERMRLSKGFKSYMKRVTDNNIVPYVITNTNVICEIINDRIINAFGWVMHSKCTKNKYKIDGLMKIKENLHNIEITNNDLLRIVSVDEEKGFTLLDVETDKTHVFTFEEYDKYFVYGYCHTLFSSQGKSIKEEQLFIINTNSTPREIYVALSRIQNGKQYMHPDYEMYTWDNINECGIVCEYFKID